MERGSSSDGRRSEKLNPEEIAALTKMTMEKIMHRHSHRRGSSSTTVKFYDMTSVGYGWLLPGWVAEERQVKSGRIYRYYYDPEGYFYKSQRMVIESLEKCGMVVLDT